MKPYNYLVSFKVINQEFQLLLQENTPKTSIFRVHKGSKIQEPRTRLLRYLRNALELVELTGGGASGTDPGHGKP